MVLRYPASSRRFRVQDCHLLRSPFPECSANDLSLLQDPTTPKYMYSGLGSSPFARRYSGNLLIDFSSWSYLDGSVHSVRLLNLLIQLRIPLSAAGFPIRISPDQCSFGSSPKLFAAFYVLHRLLLPRHPPYTSKIHCYAVYLFSFSKSELVLFQLPVTQFIMNKDLSFLVESPLSTRKKSWWRIGESNS